eukprot:scaffold110295_cov48-Phaeocystis_antarctica.AAC.2
MPSGSNGRGQTRPRAVAAAAMVAAWCPGTTLASGWATRLVRADAPGAQSVPCVTSSTYPSSILV